MNELSVAVGMVCSSAMLVMEGEVQVSGEEAMRLSSPMHGIRGSHWTKFELACATK